MATKTFTAAITTAAILIGSIAHAGQITLSRPIDGASLHDIGADMTVYYTDNGATFEIVATYLKKSRPGRAQRMRMALMDGDRVSFALPGLSHTQYIFERSGQTVSVTSQTTGTHLAQR